MEKKMKRIMVAHPAQQHSYRTAIAIKRYNRLFKYSTTVYSKKNSIKMKLVKLFLKKDNLKRANGRRCEELSDEQIIQFYETRGFIELLFIRLNKKLYKWWSRNTTDKFGKKVANYAIKHNIDAVIMYDTKSNECFRILKSKAPGIKRILDMSAPSINYMDKIFIEDINKNPKYSEDIKSEIESNYHKVELKRMKEELENTNYFLVASEFTKKSLKYNNIEDEKIFLCPYGVDTRYFNILSKESKKVTDKVLNCIFIGRVTEQKGAFHLFNAINKINSELISLTLLGEYDKCSNYYKDFKERCSFLGHVTRDKVIEECQRADILVFPSLADGYGLSVIEAMACGLPVICSSNAGVSDIIENYYNGFKVRAADDNELIDRLEWCINNKEKLINMGNNARKTVLDIKWERYYESIEMALTKIENN